MKEDFDWVKRCIESCTNDFQLKCMPGMLKLFLVKHFDQAGYNLLVESMMEQENKINVDA